MNDTDRRMYKPAPKAGQLKCPKCLSEMRPESKNAKVSICPKCGFKINRVKF